ncbi:MAG: (2Fe-2S) ferredoxin domain-containing protein [Phormidesmis sp.]
MDVLQGRYLKKIKSKEGKLKGLKVETNEGILSVYLPKALREVAKKELTPGDDVRVWGSVCKKKGKKQSKGRSLQAEAVIPLSPQAKVKLPKKKKIKPMTVQLCQKKNCCKRGGTKLWETFGATEQSSTPFKLEAVGCLGGCKRGPNIRFLPDNVKHYHVQPEQVERLLAEHQA